MLRKLLKYDLKALFKMWWIPAVTTIVLSIFKGFTQMAYNNDKMLPNMVYGVISLFSSLVTISYVVFVIMTLVVIFSRFYKNFYTDEGYLTFTLPVSKVQHINSKLISSTLVSWATGLVLIINFLITIVLSEIEYINFDTFFVELKEMLSNTLAYEWIVFFGGFIIVLLLPIAANLFLFFCISVGSTVVKKAKVITSIAIFYGSTSVFFVALQILLIFGIDSIEGWLVDFNDTMFAAAIALMLLIIILFIVMIIGVLYALQYWILDRKLNLS